MSRKKEEPRGTSSVSFRVPDFVDEDGIEYTNIEVIVEMDGDIRDAANLAESMQRSTKARAWRDQINDGRQRLTASHAS